MATGLSFGNNNRTTDFTTEVERLDNEYDFVGQVLNFEERTTAHANITFDITDKKIVIPQGNKRGAGDFTKGQEKDVTVILLEMHPKEQKLKYCPMKPNTILMLRILL